MDPLEGLRGALRMAPAEHDSYAAKIQLCTKPGISLSWLYKGTGVNCGLANGADTIRPKQRVEARRYSFRNRFLIKYFFISI